MVTQQVLRPQAQAAVFLVLTVREGSEAAVREVLADIPGLTRAVGFRSPVDGLSTVVGIGAELWDRTYDLPRPAGLHPFEEIAGHRHRAVSTPGDLLIHLRAGRADLCFELARQIMSRLSGHADVVDEVHGFAYFERRDLLGFVDGTENPEGDDAVDAVTIGDEDPAYAGGSYVLVQKYLHDLAAWDAISVEEQERVIGRTKLDDIELADDVKPVNSHVALNTVEDDDGNDLDIVRHNMPFGSVGDAEFGTYFIGYAADPAVIELMLRNMFIGRPPGTYDRILDFSTAITGSLFFVPTVAFLEDPPSAPVAAVTASAESPAAAPDDGSLGIGSLHPRATQEALS
ncbi:Dyp-type peroxidase [Luteipulveratus halotolerans]|uniref:Peroxidase n=1 Tax=Luteipulveratus halotolerans TaxID=1631356 RepID=A0A0L6CI37_9MICO|nr:Dyp-type peroxidase [Luteipulveratus halotolerans]KNX37447.1 peroxidase [Luteipulveratus halotolerans]